MSPEQQQINELKDKVATLERSFASLQSAATVDPLISRMILDIVGLLGLSNLSDVSLSAPTNGQVLEYLNGVWINATDNT